VAFEDVEAYAKWAERTYPRKPSGEFAARGGLRVCRIRMGDEFEPGGTIMAQLLGWELPL